MQHSIIATSQDICECCVRSQEIQFWRESCGQLEEGIKLARTESDELANLLNEDSIRRELLEKELDQHKSFLQDRILEAEEKDRTINTQNFLLSFAWEDAQEKDHVISQLRD